MSSRTSSPSHPAGGPVTLDVPLAREVMHQALMREGAAVVSARTDIVESRPGTGTCVGWDVTIDNGGQRAQVYLVVSDANLAERSGSLAQVSSDTGTFYVWRFPSDPLLPALAPIAELATAPAITAAWTGPVMRIDVVAYRPLRRAVLRITGDEGSVFAKVLLPRKVADTVNRHTMMVGSGIPAPSLLRWQEDGLVLLSTLRNAALAELLHGNAASHPDIANLDPRGVIALLDALPAAALQLRPQTPWADRMSEFGAEHAAAADANESPLDAYWRDLAAEVRHRNQGVDLGPLLPTHGDLNAANLRVPLAGQDRWGVIDLDTIGPGHRVDDLACLIAHLAALPAFDPGRYACVPEVLRRFLAHFDTVVDPATLRVRAAGVLVTLAVAEKDELKLQAWAQVARDLLDQASAFAAGRA